MLTKEVTFCFHIRAKFKRKVILSLCNNNLNILAIAF
jgi:hypothetical protein